MGGQDQNSEKVDKINRMFLGKIFDNKSNIIKYSRFKRDLI